MTERERAAASLRFLAEASEQLSESLDYDLTLARVTRLAVPYLADWCTVDLLEEDGRIHRVAAAHADLTREALLHETLRQYPMKLDEPRGVAVALQTGRTLIRPVVTPEEVQTVARDRRHLEILQELRPRSHLIVPLISHGQRFGALSLLYSEDSGRNYVEADVPLAEDLARRCAQAVENARLYRAASEAEERVRVLNAESRVEDERQARLTAEQALASRDEFLSVAAHELKTPITSLLGAVQLLLRQQSAEMTLAPAQTSRSLQIVERQTSKLGRLVAQLLETSRIEQGRMVLDWDTVDLAALLAAAVEQARTTTSRHAIVLAAPAAVQAHVDGLRVEQVVGNLLDNAIKFSPDGGLVEVELAPLEADAVRLTVRDHGIGIPPEHLSSLFGRYHQAHAESHRSGLGLGLYISRRIVELHGGRIEVELPTGAGARFVVYLPTRRASVAALASTYRRQAPA